MYVSSQIQFQGKGYEVSSIPQQPKKIGPSPKVKAKKKVKPVEHADGGILWYREDADLYTVTGLSVDPNKAARENLWVEISRFPTFKAALDACNRQCAERDSEGTHAIYSPEPFSEAQRLYVMAMLDKLPGSIIEASKTAAGIWLERAS